MIGIAVGSIWERLDDVVGDLLVEVPEDLGERAGYARRVGRRHRLVQRHHVVGARHRSFLLAAAAAAAAAAVRGVGVAARADGAAEAEAAGAGRPTRPQLEDGGRPRGVAVGSGRRGWRAPREESGGGDPQCHWSGGGGGGGDRFRRDAT